MRHFSISSGPEVALLIGMLCSRSVLLVLATFSGAVFAGGTQKQYRELIQSCNAALTNQNVQISDRQPLRKHLLSELRYRLDQAIARTSRLQKIAERFYEDDLKNRVDRPPELNAETLTALEDGDIMAAKDLLEEEPLMLWLLKQRQEGVIQGPRDPLTYFLEAFTGNQRPHYPVSLALLRLRTASDPTMGRKSHASASLALANFQIQFVLREKIDLLNFIANSFWSLAPDLQTARANRFALLENVRNKNAAEFSYSAYEKIAGGDDRGAPADIVELIHHQHLSYELVLIRKFYAGEEGHTLELQLKGLTEVISLSEALANTHSFDSYVYHLFPPQFPRRFADR